LIDKGESDDAVDDYYRERSETPDRLQISKKLSIISLGN
jgi:hypothetical protein